MSLLSIFIWYSVVIFRQWSLRVLDIRPFRCFLFSQANTTKNNLFLYFFKGLVGAFKMETWTAGGQEMWNFFYSKLRLPGTSLQVPSFVLYSGLCAFSCLCASLFTFAIIGWARITSSTSVSVVRHSSPSLLIIATVLLNFEIFISSRIISIFKVNVLRELIRYLQISIGFFCY